MLWRYRISSRQGGVGRKREGEEAGGGGTKIRPNGVHCCGSIQWHQSGTGGATVSANILRGVRHPRGLSVHGSGMHGRTAGVPRCSISTATEAASSSAFRRVTRICAHARAYRPRAHAHRVQPRVQPPSVSLARAVCLAALSPLPLQRSHGASPRPAPAASPSRALRLDARTQPCRARVDCLLFAAQL